jgi:hypothetical protein
LSDAECEVVKRQAMRVVAQAALIAIVGATIAALI